jgi:L-serine dehydratase
MTRSVQAGFQAETVAMPLLEPSAGRIWQALIQQRSPLGGPLSRAAARAMACMHTCNSKGVVCAAPTGGSAGVIPGALMTLAEERSMAHAEIAQALFAAGTVGLIVAHRATFAAEIAGCQVEIGAAGAMAAAMVVDACGGDAAQALDAAAIALQNTMGSVCDPVDGGCEIPCHTRNATAASSAFTCADLILGGYQNPIGLDQTIDASFAVGRSLPRELRCTALGGIATTPAAQELAHRAAHKSRAGKTT